MRFTVEITGDLLKGLRQRADGLAINVRAALKDTIIVGALASDVIRDPRKHGEDVSIYTVVE